MGHVDRVLALTAIALLLRPTGDWYVRPLLLGIAIVMLVSPRVLRLPAAWAIVAGLIAIRIAADWPLADNHIYLFAYWALAIALSLSAGVPGDTLATASRALLFSAFALAVLWKAWLAPDFADGRFFRVTLLTDPRFTDVALLVGGLSPEQFVADQEYLEPLPEGAALLEAPPFHEPQALRAFAFISSWGVIALELAVAIAMIVPGAATLRHLTVLLFCGVSYAFAPVAGFGWLILIMGFAQSQSAHRRWQVAYVAAFLAVLLYSEIPWASLLREMSQTNLSALEKLPDVID